MNCSGQGLPTPALRWIKVRGQERAPGPWDPCLHPLPPSHPSLSLSPPQDSIPLRGGPTLPLSSVTFDSAGTYTCEASTPTIPLLSRTQSFKLLVQGSGWDRWMRTMEVGDQDKQGSMAGGPIFRSSPSLSPLSPHPSPGASHSLFIPHHPQGRQN